MKFITIFDPKSELNIVGHSRISLAASILFPLFCFVSLWIFGIPWGIDFLGGMEMRVKFQKPVAAHEIRDVLHQIGFDKNQVQQYGPIANNEILVRVERMAALQAHDVERVEKLLKSEFALTGDEKRVLFDAKNGNQLALWLDEPAELKTADPLMRKEILENQKKKLADLIEAKSELELRKSAASKDATPDIYGAITADEAQNGRIRYTLNFEGVSKKISQEFSQKFGAVEIRSVGFVDSQVSSQLRTDGLLAVTYAIIAIVIYVAIRFDLFFAPGAILALIMDVLAAMMVFALGRVEFDTPSIAALLTILGYSINNTIVIYDRIRETMPHGKKELNGDELKAHVNTAINDTMSRSINTTLTVLFASVSIWIFASAAIQSFAIVLTVGICFGGFTSVFVSPAAYLLAKRYIRRSSDNNLDQPGGLTREDRAKGVV
jgi:preprotein translocase subunit SecF